MTESLPRHLAIEVKTSRSGDFTLGQRDIDGVLPDGHVAFLIEARRLGGPRWLLAPARKLSPRSYDEPTLDRLADGSAPIQEVVSVLNARWSDWILDRDVQELLFEQDAMKFKDAMRWCLTRHPARRSRFSGAIREGKLAAALVAFRALLDPNAAGSSGPQLEGYVHQYILQDAFTSLGYRVTNNPIGVPDFDARLERDRATPSSPRRALEAWTPSSPILQNVRETLLDLGDAALDEVAAQFRDRLEMD